MKEVIIWGASGHARVAADILRLRGEYRIAGFLDNVDATRHHTEFCGAEILGGEAELDALRARGLRTLLMAFGHNEERLRWAAFAEEKGFSFATAIHPSAVIAADAVLEPGVVAAAGVVVNPGCRIGRHAILNTACTVDHDNVIAAGAHISPGAHLAGQVTVGECAWVGIGACVIDHLSIGDHAWIGAGGVVIRDVPAGVVAAGNPVRILRKRDLA